MFMKKDRLVVRKVRSHIGCNISQKRTLLAMGLRKMNQETSLPNTDSVRGMIRKVFHLVKVVE